ncbi:MAG: hypothetical protein ACFCUO_11485 [Rhodospirillales bacterium]
MISTFIPLPFGCWAHCRFPAVVDGGSFLGTVANGGDWLVWIGRLQLAVGHSARRHRDGALAAAPVDRLYRLPRGAPSDRR